VGVVLWNTPMRLSFVPFHSFAFASRRQKSAAPPAPALSCDSSPLDAFLHQVLAHPSTWTLWSPGPWMIRRHYQPSHHFRYGAASVGRAFSNRALGAFLSIRLRGARAHRRAPHHILFTESPAQPGWPPRPLNRRRRANQQILQFVEAGTTIIFLAAPPRLPNYTGSNPTTKSSRRVRRE